MRRAWAVAVKELEQIRRDRRTLLVLLFIPAFFLFLYGYALNFDIHHVALAVEDRDLTADSRALVASFQRSTYFDVVATVNSPAATNRLMDRGTARALLVIPEGFSATILEGDVADVQVILDGDNANTATTVLGYSTAVLREAGAQMGGSVRAAIVGFEPRIWYNPELRSTLFLVPGLIAYIATITAVLSTALSIVREKENGTMEQVRMAPISTPAFVIGKTLPYLVISQASAMLVVVAAMILFDMPMRGSWATLSLTLAVFLVGGIGTGLLVSTAAESQQIALQASMLIAFLPTFILSGFIFPITSMPVAIQYVTTVVPARYFLTALRGIVLKGLGLHDVWRPLMALVIYACATLGISAVRLTRQ
jgi:ABC-2 type transport system permease protein